VSKQLLLDEADAADPTAERRKAPRRQVLQRCFVRLPGTAGDGWRCIAYDISAAGIGLAVPLPLKEGTTLEVEPWGLRGARPLRARVVHSRPLGFLWLCGCELTERLAGEDLQAWVPEVPDLA
jgi:hypothetical protein